MVGYSYSGYNQLWVAAQRPPSLKAIAPGKNVADPYRDVAYPGGIQNIGFPANWWRQFPAIWREAAHQARTLDGDTDCARVVEDNIRKIQRPDLDMARWLDEDRFFGARYASKSAMYSTHRIDIPTLGTQSWQDEQVGPRMGYYEDSIAPDRMWLISSNGDHHTDNAPFIRETMKRFYARFLKGEDNGFERSPRVLLAQELQWTQGRDNYAQLRPSAVASFDRLPVRVTPMPLWLQPDGRLGDAPPQAERQSASYRYPLPGSEANDPEADKDSGAGRWTPSPARDGLLRFTTAPLPRALSFYGEASLDLWLSATASDTDVQVTLSEVRPDGQEMFVQRGWLRASMRALDSKRSTALRPWGDFTESAVLALKPGEPTLMRVEIQKFAHVFRAGSSLRVTLDTPSQTGFWAFDHLSTPSVNTVWLDRNRPSKIVLGHIGYAHASELADCSRMLRQPCRPNEEAVPTGVGPMPPL
jgi:putative CocE/NonD family hydrolase